MKSKRLLLLLLMAIGLPWVANAQTVTIGTGTSTHHSAPIANYYNYSLAEMLFTSAEIGTTDVNTILSIGFEGANSSAKTYGITVYMKNVDVQSFTATGDYIQVSANDVVFTGSLKPATGWNTITLDTPFAYDNTKSLLVVVNKTSGGYDSSTQIWKYTSTSSTYKMLYSQNDSSPGVYDPTGSPSLSLNYERPNVQLTFGVPPTCFQPQNLQATLTPGSGTIATLTWNRHVSGTENAWVLQYGEDNTFATGSYTELTNGFTVTTVEGVTTVTANLSSLTAEHTYYARVKPDCDTDGTLWSEVLKFKPTNAIPQTVCDGTTTNGFVPVYGNYAENYNKDEFIIPATTEGMANMASGTIKGMTFYLATPAADLWGAALYRVFLKEVNESSFESNSYYGTDGATIVYEGALDGTQSTMTIEFTTDYEYNGGNLLVGVYEYTKGTFKSCSFYGITSTNGALYKNNSTSLESITSGSMQDFIPKTTFTYIPSNTPKPRNLEVSNLSSSGATLTWQAPANGTPTSYEYQYKLATDQWPATWTSNGTNLSVSLSGLTASATYDFRVRATYTGGPSESIETQFTTLDACAFPTGLAATLVYGNGTVATLSWTKGYDETEWVLQYGTDNTFATGTYTEKTDGFTVDGNTVTCNLTSLTAEATYYARVKAKCSATSSSSWSNVVEFLPTNFVDYTYNNNATSSTSNHPFYGSYTTSATNQSQFVIPAAELTEIAGGTIRSITYYTSSTTLTTNWGGVIFDVYMAEVDNSTFSTATFIDWETLNNVYTGTVSLSNGMMTIAFDRNYTYNGGNLLIGFKTNTEGTTTQNVSWTASYRSSEYYVVYQYSNNSASRTYYFPKVTFSYQPTPYKYPVINEANCTYTTTSAHIAWTVTGATPPPTGYQYQFKTAEGEWPTSWSSTTNAYADLSSLTHSTIYDFRVKALYDGGYESIAVNYRFATECDAITTFPVTYGFETTEGFPDNASAPTTNQLGACWRNEATVQTGSYATRVWGTSTSYKHDGSQALVLPDKGSGCRTMLVFPAMDFTSSSGYIVSFWIYRNSTGSNPEGFKMYISDCDTIGPNAVLLGHYSRNYSIAYPVVESTSAWYQYETEPITMTGTVYLIFEGQSYFGSATYVDDITIEAAPTCWQPQNLAASNVTNEAATLTWERNTYGHETEWVLQYGEDNTFATYIGQVTVNTNPTYAIESGLSASTTYYFRVKPACDTEGNLWAESSFETEADCAAPTNLAVTENSETIEGATITWNGRNDSFIVDYGLYDYTATPTVVTVVDNEGFEDGIPTGWAHIGAGSLDTPTSSTYSPHAHAGSKSLKFSGTTDANVVVLPQFAQEANTMTVSFWSQAEGSSSGEFDLGYVTNPSNASTFHAVHTRKYSEDGTTYTEVSNISMAEVPEGARIAFRHRSSSSSWYWFIDEVTIVSTVYPLEWHTAGTAANENNTGSFIFTGLDDNTTYYARVKGVCGSVSSDYSDVISFTTLDACPAPANLTLGTVTNNSATINWNGGLATEWKVWIKESTATDYPTSYSTVTTATKSFDNLTANTLYDVKIAPTCDETRYLEVPDAFRTDCEAITAFPWSEDFEGYAVGNLNDPCWVNEHISGDGNLIFDVNNSTNADNSTNQLRLPDQAAGTLTKLVLPEMTLPNANYWFSIDVYRSSSTYNESLIPYEGIRVYASTNGEIEGATELAFIPRQYTESNAVIPAETATGWYTYKLHIGISGTCYIILRGESQYSTSTYMDNFAVVPGFTKHIIGYNSAEGNGNNYYLIASPLADAVDPTTVGMITDDYGAEATPANSTYDFYRFDQEAALEWVNYREAAFDLVNGQGYLYASKNGTTLTFTGAPYSGTTKGVTLNKTNDSSADFPGWNLVGNPFPDTAYIDRPFYKMDESGARFLSQEQTAAIPPMEGIFVIANEDGDVVTFTKQVPGAKANIILNLTQGRGNTIDRAVIGAGIGRTLPKFMLNPYDTKLYIPQNGEDYAVVRSRISDEIPVNFVPAVDGYYNISVDVRNMNLRTLTLKDKVRNVTIDLLHTPTYHFKASVRDRADRFVLTFRNNPVILKEKIVKGANSEDFGFYSYGNWIIDNEGEATLQVIDLNGRVLSTENIYGSTSIQVDAAPGIYMLRLINGDNVKVQKVVVE